MPVDRGDFAQALRQYAAGVALLCVQDDIDDVGTTVTSVMSVSADPPLVALALTTGGYPLEVLETVGTGALTFLAAEHEIVASRFASAGRPSARHLLETVPWQRAGHSGGIVLTGGVAALDCRVDRLVGAGDHTLVLLEVVDVPVLEETRDPLLRLRGRWTDGAGRTFRR
ncbi:NADH-FMN oxidoreductase RutF, flavin reductase (DIM6/NTAB) family [Klenkia soli]|uniref:NADH-FMN oxidoreductase RutF, flavin reductase (DIM6/NTAB) family n=1 Tax=Klenkia soli TaxID=1052260 RepID=A0A1H0KEZ8_9ACTN|nr:flavin reductase family protein [Klenkia soli]SDO54538.1 NADH-FMN oxidoreductase RutF, flavin reductase (DIM6/NTAB) family [Klenkia soli]